MRSADTVYTPTQLRLMALLADGQPKTPEDLRGVLDDFTGDKAVKVHIMRLRRILPAGQVIISETVRGVFRYRLARLLADDE